MVDCVREMTAKKPSKYGALALMVQTFALLVFTGIPLSEFPAVVEAV